MSNKIIFNDLISFEKEDLILDTRVSVDFDVTDVGGLVLYGPNPSIGSTPTPGLNNPNMTVNGTLTITGDLVVVGAQVGVVAPDLIVEDKRIFVNKPNPSFFNADGSGVIVIRDTDDGLSSGDQHAGIIWNDIELSWDLNYGISIDAYSTDLLTPTNLPANPRIINLGDPVDPQDAATMSWVQTQLSLPALGGLSDVTITSPSLREVLVYDSGLVKWINSALQLTDITDFPVPVADGYLKATMPGTYTFEASIPAADLAGLSQVATSGLMVDLSDVSVLSPMLGDVLRYNGTAWENSAVLNFTKIANAEAPNQTAFVSTTDVDDSVLIYATKDVIMHSGATSSIILQTDNTTSSSSVKIAPYDVNFPNAANTEPGILESDIGLVLRSYAGSVQIQSHTFPNVDGTSGQALLTDGAGILYWGESGGNAESFRITDDNGTTYVDTMEIPDVIKLRAPNLGASGVNDPIIDPVGIIIDPGIGRWVEIPGSGVSTISTNDILSLVSPVNIMLDAGIDVVIQEYIFPKPSAIRNAGDVLTIDITDVNKKRLKWVSFGMDDLADVTLTSPNTLEFLKYDGSEWVNSTIEFADIQLAVSGLALSDIDGIAPPNPLGFLRWDAFGQFVEPVNTIPADVLDLDGITSNIIPVAPSVANIGTVGMPFDELHVGRINGGTAATMFKLACSAGGGFNESYIFAPLTWSHTRLSTGRYEVTHTLSNYAYVVTPTVIGATPRFVVVESKTGTSFIYRVFDITGTLVDNAVDLVVTR